MGLPNEVGIAGFDAPPMIRRYNITCYVTAVALLVGSLLCYGLAWLFFRYGLSLVAWNFRVSWTASQAAGIAWAALLAITISGFWTWKRRGGFSGFGESALYVDLMDESGGGVMVEHSLNRVTGPSHVLSQVFLGGPLLALRAFAKANAAQPTSSDLEVRLGGLLAEIQTANRWQGLTDYPGRQREIAMLGQMKKIDLSTHNGRWRFKFNSDL